MLLINRILIFLLLIGSLISKDMNNKINFIPVLGQIENKKYIKAIFLGTAMTYSTSKYIDYSKNNKISKRNTYVWWMLGLYFYGLIDAYVDDHFKSFPKKKDEIS